MTSDLAISVSNDALRGTTPQAAAQVLQWVSFADSEVIPPASAWVFPTLGIMQFNKQVCSSAFFYSKMIQAMMDKTCSAGMSTTCLCILGCQLINILSVQATEQAKEDIKKVLGVLNQHLNTRTFLVGERVSLADITVVCSMLWLFKQVWHLEISQVGLLSAHSTVNVSYSIDCTSWFYRNQVASTWIWHLFVYRSWSLPSVSPIKMWPAGLSPVLTSPSSRLFLEKSNSVKRWLSLMVSHQRWNQKWRLKDGWKATIKANSCINK